VAKLLVEGDEGWQPDNIRRAVTRRAGAGRIIERGIINNAINLFIYGSLFEIKGRIRY
jgi:hypothetical protein